MLEEEEPHEREVSFIRGQQIKWEGEKLVHRDVAKELQRLQEFED
jgi:hypothetical protein